MTERLRRFGRWTVLGLILGMTSGCAALSSTLEGVIDATERARADAYRDGTPATADEAAEEEYDEEGDELEAARGGRSFWDQAADAMSQVSTDRREWLAEHERQRSKLESEIMGIQQRREAELRAEEEAKEARERARESRDSRRGGDPHPHELVGTWNSRAGSISFARSGAGFTGRMNAQLTDGRRFSTTMRNIRVTHAGLWVSYEGQIDCTPTGGFRGWRYLRLTLYAPSEMMDRRTSHVDLDWGCTFSLGSKWYPQSRQD